MFDAATEILLLLILVAFVAGFVDAIAGGRGLITIPALLLAGFPPVEALGTNKLQGVFDTGSAVYAYAPGGHVNVRSQLPSAALSFCAAVLGALVATALPGDLLRGMLPVLLVAVALYFALRPNLGDLDRAQRITPFAFGVTLCPCSVSTTVLLAPAPVPSSCSPPSLAGKGLLKATVHTKFLNFASNLGGLAAFAAVGAISWKTGLLMGVAQITGARLGAGFAIRNGGKLIKPLLIVVCLALAIRLLMDADNPLRGHIGL